MPRLYTISVGAVSISAAQDLFEIRPVANHPIQIIGLQIGQTNSTTQENLGLSIIRGHTSSGSAGSTPTIAPVDDGDAAAGFAAEINNTTIASGGTGVTLFTDTVNLLAGYSIWFYDEKTRIPAHAGHTTIVVRLTAPAAARTFRATLWVLEL